LQQLQTREDGSADAASDQTNAGESGEDQLMRPTDYWIGIFLSGIVWAIIEAAIGHSFLSLICFCVPAVCMSLHLLSLHRRMVQRNRRNYEYCRELYKGELCCEGIGGREIRC
jgi:hypothetical protein